MAGVAQTCPGGGPVLSNTQGNASKLIYKNGNTRLNAEFTVKLNHFVRERAGGSGGEEGGDGRGGFRVQSEKKRRKEACNSSLGEG